MDSHSEDDDCKMEVIITPPKKKLKQAQLPFHTQSSLNSSNNATTKKRKLVSPSVGCKTPKVKKISEGSSVKDMNDDALVDIENIQNSNSESKTPLSTRKRKAKKNSNKQNDESDNEKTDSPKDSNIYHKKNKTTKQEQSGALAKFFKKADKVNKDDSIDDSHNTSLNSVAEENKEQKCKSSNEKILKTSSSELQLNKSLNILDKSSVENIDEQEEAENDEVEEVVLKSTSEDSSDENNDSKVDYNDSNKSGDESSIRTPKSDRSSIRKKNRTLTPKQLERKMESERKRQEKEQRKLERKKEREEARLNRRLKEEKEKAEKEQRKREKEMKEQKKQMEIEQKQKEKEAREEERRKREEAKEEERKKKEEERRKKEEAKEEEKRKREEEKLEAERKKQKAASNFASFFVAKKTQESKSIEEERNVESKNFMPFEIKAEMKIAPICRRILNNDEKLYLEKEFSLSSTSFSKLYIHDLKNNILKPRKSEKTWPLEAKDDVVILEEDGNESQNVIDETPKSTEKLRPKLLQFNENRRPPYWGTWRKRSRFVNPRKPFTKDSKWFDYEVDSDDEWEEEEPGESLKGSDDEKEEENPDDNEYDVDNEFMVPHGYLSDEEVQADEDNEDMSPETQKYKLKLLGEEFEAEMKSKTSKLKPRVIGCIWQNSDNTFPENTPSKIVELLRSRQAWTYEIPIVLPLKSEMDTTFGECSTPQHRQSSVGKKKSIVPEDAIPDLIRLVHGNINGRNHLVKEFVAFWNKFKNENDDRPLFKITLSRKIKDIATWMACPDEGAMYQKPCWYVSQDIRERYLPNDKRLELPNQWTYILKPLKKSETTDGPDKSEKEEVKDKKNVSLITQFTKKISPNEMKKQLLTTSNQSSSSKTTQANQRPPKRATLISVGRGEQFSKTSRKSLWKKFVNVQNNDSNEKEDSEKNQISIVTIDDDSNSNQLGTGNEISVSCDNEVIKNDNKQSNSPTCSKKRKISGRTHT